MPETILLTRERLMKCAGGGMGFTKAQLSLLGVEWPPASGWLDSVVSQQRYIPVETYEQLLALRGLRKTSADTRLLF